jgi:hypothetical protein
MIYIETLGMRIVGRYNGKELAAEFDQKYIIPAVSNYHSGKDSRLICKDLPIKKHFESEDLKWGTLRESIEKIESEKLGLFSLCITPQNDCN